jgi:hypothetical protein
MENKEKKLREVQVARYVSNSSDEDVVEENNRDESIR